MQQRQKVQPRPARRLQPGLFDSCCYLVTQVFFFLPPPPESFPPPVIVTERSI